MSSRSALSGFSISSAVGSHLVDQRLHRVAVEFAEVDSGVATDVDLHAPPVGRAPASPLLDAGRNFSSLFWRSFWRTYLPDGLSGSPDLSARIRPMLA